MTIQHKSPAKPGVKRQRPAAAPASGILTVRLPDDLRLQLDRAAKAGRRSRGSIIKDALAGHLSSLGQAGDDKSARHKLDWIARLSGVGARAHGSRSVREIDALIDEIRGDK